MPEEPEQPERTNTEYSVRVAEVTGAHGVSGTVRLRLMGGDAEAATRSLPAGRKVLAVRDGGDAGRILTLSSLRKQTQPKGAWVAHFKEITDRNAAETLYGAAMLIKEDERAALPDGEYYVDELFGLNVVTETGASLGKLTEVLTTPANDVYVTDTKVMIPAVPAFILHVDLSAGTISVRDMPGLREMADPNPS